MRRVLCCLLAIVLAMSLCGSAFAAERLSPQRGYYGGQLTDGAAQDFYDVLTIMDFASGGDATVTSSRVLALAEPYANGDMRLMKSFGAAVDSFRYDHTDLFYVDWDMLSVRVGKKNGAYTVTIGRGRTDTYLRDKTADINDQASVYKLELEDLVTDVQANVESGMSRKEIARIADTFVSKRVEYSFCDNPDGTASEASKYIRTAYGALVNRKAVCEGYARLYKAVLNQLAIPCELVSGYYLDGESFEPHMWVYVQDTDGKWYAVDPTMNDGYRLHDGSDETEYPKYFWQTEEIFGIDHIEDGKVSSVEYDMPYPKLYQAWISPTESGRFEYGTKMYDGKPSYWFSFDGKNAEELLTEDGLYMAVRAASTNKGQMEWSAWQSLQEYNRLIPGIAPSDGSVTYFQGDNIAMPVLEVGVFDIAEDVEHKVGDIVVSYSYSPEAVTTHLIETVSVENASYDESYIAPAYISKTEPEELFQRRQDITETQHVVLTYSDRLREVGDGLSLTWDVSSYNNRDLKLSEVRKNAKLENVKFDGNRTISFDFTPSKSYNHNMIFYDFSVSGMVNVLADGSDGVALRDFSIMYEYKDDIACCKIYNDGRLYVNSYAQPSLALNGDLSMTGWTYEDVDENGQAVEKRVSESQRSQMALVVAPSNHDAELKEAVDADEALAAKTYEIDLNICGKIVQIPNGSYMRLNLGIPDEFAELAKSGDVEFKLYHFKRMDDGSIDYSNPEAIKCTLTPYGIIAEVNDFSPYVLTAVSKPETETVRSGVLVADSFGGTVNGPHVIELTPHDVAVYQVACDDGYEIENVTVGGEVREVLGDRFTVSYDDLGESNVIAVRFISKSVVSEEDEVGEEIIDPEIKPLPDPGPGEDDGEDEDHPGESGDSPVNPGGGGTIDTPVETLVETMLDTTNHQAYLYGRDQDLFCPEAKLTRAEAAALLYRLLKPEVRDSVSSQTTNFIDVPMNAWYAKEVSILYQLDIIHGKSSKIFAPNDTITRAEFATMLSNLVTGDINMADAKTFTDTNGHWGEEHIARIFALGWVSGVGNGKFDPNGQVTRAQAAVMMNRATGRKVSSVDELGDGMRTWKDNADTSKWYYLDVQIATNNCK